MRFQLSLQTYRNTVLPLNYQYPLSAAIYKIIQQADERYSNFLHNDGYRLENGKSFKLFCFSDLRVPYRIAGDRMQINGAPAQLTIGFHIDEAASNFIKGLFINKQLEIADKKSGNRISVNEVQLLPDVLSAPGDDVVEMIVEPLSPLVVGRKNERDNYDFLIPGNADFTEWLVHNWMEKYRAVCRGNIIDIERLKKNIRVEVLTPMQEIKSRLITIKAFTPQQTQIRGFTRFQMKIRAPKVLMELALNAGMGLYNAMGFGCVGVERIKY
jgi:CRISPR-associated endoribonuclease Cas6